MVRKPLIIGSRGSALALRQAELVKSALEREHRGLSVEITVIRTTGDKILDSPLSQIGDKGLFTREIESELLGGAIDLAVHSLKDLPTESPAGLTIAAVTAREDVADVLVSKNQYTFATLPESAVVLSGSLRRRAQMLHRRADLKISDVRGNIHTRLRKLDESEAAAIVMAAAGLNRAGLSHRIAERFEPTDFLPAPGQGALALQVRSDDKTTADLVAPLEDPASRVTTFCERRLLAALEGGCQIPIGAYAHLEEDKLHLRAMIASLDGATLLTAEDIAPADQSEPLGVGVARKLLDQGAGEILQEILKHSPSRINRGYP